MKTAFRFMPSSLRTASFFVNGKTFNQTESMSFWWFASTCSRLCVNFHVSIVHFKCISDFWPNLNFLLRHLIILSYDVIFRRILESCRLIFDEKIMAQFAFIYKKTYHSCTLTYCLVDSKFPSFILFHQHGEVNKQCQLNSYVGQLDHILKYAVFRDR